MTELLAERIDADTNRACWRRLSMAAILVLVSGHFCMVMCYFAPAIGTPDASGYFVQARLIATQGQTWFDRQSPLQYINHHWLSPGGGRYFSQYPPGLAVACAVVYRLAGQAAALLVNPVLASLTLLGLFLLGRLWIGAGWGLLAAALMAVNPITNEHALSCDSHTAVAFLLVWGIYGLARWSQKRTLGLAALAGMALGIVPTVRYPESLFLVAGGSFMLALIWRDRQSWRSLFAFVIGAMIPIACLLVRNQLAFGAFWKTGYTLSHEQTAFAFDSLLRKALPYLGRVVGEGTGLVAAVGLIAMPALCGNRRTRREGLLIVSLVMPITLVYMAYGLPEMSLRFLIPVFFLYALAAAWGIKLLTACWPGVALIVAAGLLGGVVGWGLPRSLAQCRRLARENGALAQIARIASDYVLPGSIVIADPRIQQQLDYAGQWKLVDESLLTGIDPDPAGPPLDRNHARGNRPPPGGGGGGPRAVHEQERRQILTRYADRQSIRLGGRMLEDLDTWRGDDKIYWIGSLTVMRRLLPAPDQLRVVVTIPALIAAQMPPPRPGFKAPRQTDGGELSVVEWIRSTNPQETR